MTGAAVVGPDEPLLPLSRIALGVDPLPIHGRGEGEKEGHHIGPVLLRIVPLNVLHIGSGEEFGRLIKPLHQPPGRPPESDRREFRGEVPSAGEEVVAFSAVVLFDQFFSDLGAPRLPRCASGNQ